MSVRAKFTYTGYSTGLQPRYEKQPDGGFKQVGTDELRTMRFSPVYANNDPSHENSKFWKASPSGQIELGTINREAWEQFELGAEYYVDFIKAAPAPEVKPAD